MPQDASLNPYGTGYMTKETKITKSSTVKTDPLAARIFKISNPSTLNPVSLAPVAYKLVPISSQVLLANTDLWHHRRGDFCDAPIWVTKYKDRELFPAEDYTDQSSGGEGIRSWVARDDNVEDTDLVVWLPIHLHTTPDQRTSPSCVSPSRSRTPRAQY
jgi:primary-amine oxidase